MSVTFQRSPAGAGTWTTICAPTAAPYNCSWNTAGVSDGLYDLRATALDASGYSRTSTVSSRRVDNTAPATGVSAATPLTGTATVSATATDGGSGVISVAFEARPSSGGSWTPICTDGSSPYSCPWDTTTVADGAWDVRATTTDGAGNTSSATPPTGSSTTPHRRSRSRTPAARSAAPSRWRRRPATAPARA